MKKGVAEQQSSSYVRHWGRSWEKPKPPTASDGIARLQAENTAAGQAAASHERNGQLRLLQYSKPTVEGESGESQGLGDWYTRPCKWPLLGGGRTLALLRRPTTAREGVFTLCDGDACLQAEKNDIHYS